MQAKLVVTGETLCTRKHSSFTDRPFLDMVEIIRSADVACTNLETRIHTFKGAPMPIDTMGQEQSYQQADPFVAEELKWLGLTMIGRSNNHGMDFGPEMIREETEILEDAGLVHAGVGKNLSEATRATFLETDNGRFALVSVCIDFPPHCPAGPQGPDLPGRPGINAIHHDIRYEVSDETFDVLARLMQDTDQHKALRDDQILAFGKVFKRGKANSVQYAVDQADLTRNCRVIADAKLASDIVVVHLHQETEGHYPLKHVEDLAHALIDAGADVVMGDGPHLLQGIEIYKGRPIFYSLGNFFYQSETIKLFPPDQYLRAGLGVDALPQEAIEYRDAIRAGRVQKDNIRPLRAGGEYGEWHEAVLGALSFKDSAVTEIRLHPLWHHHEKRAQRGLPRLATREIGDRIIRKMAEYSERYGTEIRNENGVGVITKFE
ncbi:CapA family protein [Cereibacter sphaeroides]|uniref:CapA family protein n=1 Tax=Cereibacter sphaeroides TaxID=1063 RepID=UPI00399068C0